MLVNWSLALRANASTRAAWSLPSTSTRRTLPAASRATSSEPRSRETSTIAGHGQRAKWRATS
jgi:hypothetical protein